MSQQFQWAFFLLLFCAVLLPIVPAYLLFKVLPASANVTGVLHGLEIKLGGAFAGYFALFLVFCLELPKLKAVIDPPPAQAQVWRVEGQLVDEHNQGLPIAPCDINFTMPAPNEGDEDGRFRATFTTSTAPTGAVEFPYLSLAHAGFPNTSVSLDGTSSSDQQRNETVHSIRFLKPIVLSKPATIYAPTSAPIAADPDGYTQALRHN